MAVFTPAGYRDLEAELVRLKTVRRPEIAERLKHAAEFAGDLGDNLEYLDAQREQEMLEQRIDLLEERLASADVLESTATPPKTLGIGTWAELEDLDTGDHVRYRLVTSAESSPAEGRISIESPVGRSILGHRRGEVVEVLTPHGRRHLKIVGVDGGA